MFNPTFFIIKMEEYFIYRACPSFLINNDLSHIILISAYLLYKCVSSYHYMPPSYDPGFTRYSI